jgi:serine/threonine-protein kinase
MLHDVGKMKLPDDVRERCEFDAPKAGAPDDADARRQWEGHPRLGYDMIRGGVESSAAAAVLHRAGLEVEIDNVTSDAPRGIVISQDPVAGTRVKEGSTVSLSVSEGPGAAQVPDVDGLGRRAARRALTDAGFKVREREDESEDVAKNHVIRSSPTGGVQLDIGSTVTIVVSTGPPEVDVPSVVGQKIDDARSTLQDAGFHVTVTQQPSADHDPGTVLSQSPSAGGEADKGSAVQLTVAKQPDEVSVPDVTGETDTDAIRILSGAGFEVNTTREDVPTEDGDGVVLSQKPSGGKQAKPGSEVTITVGHFVAPATTTPAPAPDGGTPRGWPS